MKRKPFLFMVFFFLSTTIRADLHFLEIQTQEENSPSQKIIREYWLKKNLLRIDRKDSSLTYLYNLHNHSLVVLDQKKNKFSFYDRESLRRKLNQLNGKKSRLIKEGKKPALENSWRIDPFGVERLFYCPANKFEISPDKSPGKYLILCQNQPWAEVWLKKDFLEVEEWKNYLSGLRLFNLFRYRFFYLLPGFPEKIIGEKEKVNYQYQEISFQPIPLEIFLIPESAQPDLNQD